MKKICLLAVFIVLGLNCNAYSFCGALLPESPCIDAGVRIEGMEDSLSYNGLPRTGKYPGDEPDIGAWEWFPGVD